MNGEKYKKAILVVDDEPQNLELVATELTGKGYRIIVSDSGEKALKAMELEKPGLVLLDILMPGMNGFETLKKIKAIYPDIPVAMLTSIWDDEEYKRCIGAGAYEYVTKPIDFERLETVIFSKIFPGE